MARIEFNLAQDHAFIALDKLLKITGLASSGGEAHQLITHGEIGVNGETERQKRKKIKAGDRVTFGSQEVVIQETASS